MRRPCAGSPATLTATILLLAFGPPAGRAESTAFPARVLITNDNGIEDPKIRALARAFSARSETWVVAPSRDQSGSGSYLSITRKGVLSVQSRDLGAGIVARAVDGYPADCVVLGVFGLMKDQPPELLVSGINGGPNGNLYVAIQVKAHKFFRRRDYDILLDLDINIAQATLGAEVEIPTVEGNEKLEIPPGTQPGSVRRLRGKGVPKLRSSGRGDQLVVINVEIPTRLNGEQRQLFEQMAESLGSEVRPQERGYMDRLKEILLG